MHSTITTIAGDRRMFQTAADQDFRRPEALSITDLAASYTIGVSHCQAVLARVLSALPDDPGITRHLAPRDVWVLRTRMAGLCANLGGNPALQLGQLARASNMPARALVRMFDAALKNET